MKKILFVLALGITMLCILTGCNMGAANEDINVHVKDGSAILVKTEQTQIEYKKVKEIKIKGGSSYATYEGSYDYHNGINYVRYDYNVYYNSLTKTIKVEYITIQATKGPDSVTGPGTYTEVGRDIETRYIELINVEYVEIIY